MLPPEPTIEMAQWSVPWIVDWIVIDVEALFKTCPLRTRYPVKVNVPDWLTDRVLETDPEDREPEAIVWPAGFFKTRVAPLNLAVPV